MIVSQFKDHTTYGNLRAMLEQVMMLEVLCPDTLTDSNAVKEVSSRFCQPTFVKRKYFNENNGIEHAKRLVTQECTPTLLECSGMYLAMSALSAAVQYVEFVQQINFAGLNFCLLIYSNRFDFEFFFDSSNVIVLSCFLNIDCKKSSRYDTYGHQHNSKLRTCPKYQKWRLEALFDGLHESLQNFHGITPVESINSSTHAKWLQCREVECPFRRK